MIITVDHIRKLRPVSQNIDEVARMEPHIQEVENLWVRPAFTPEVYYKIEQSVVTDNLDRPIVYRNGKPIMLSHLGDFETLLCGGYYDDNKRHLTGLISAVGYLVYSKMILQNAVNVTAYGVVFKRGELSDHVDSATLVRASKDAEKIGLEYLRQCVEWIDFNKVASDCGPTKLFKKRKFKPIGL